MGKQFLYVEDDSMSRQVLQILLRDILGHQVTIFEDSADFMERVRALPVKPDIIFLDVQIKPLSGYEMLTLLRSDPLYKDAVIIAMTASVMSHDVDKLREAGFSGLIAKPIRKKVFPELLDRVLRGEAVWFTA